MQAWKENSTKPKCPSFLLFQVYNEATSSNIYLIIGNQRQNIMIILGNSANRTIKAVGCIFLSKCLLLKTNDYSETLTNTSDSSFAFLFVYNFLSSCIIENLFGLRYFSFSVISIWRINICVYLYLVNYQSNRISSICKILDSLS